jgi:L-threonylcarbamoyladenylate synthase
MNIQRTSKNVIQKAINIIRQGGVVICPSDTNYVLITHLYSKEGVYRIFKMKKRDRNKPLTLLLSSLSQLYLYAYTSLQSNRLINKFALHLITSILWRKETVPDYVTSGLPSVALTLFKNETLIDIVHGLNMPVVGTSANLSGTGIVPDVEKAAAQLGKDVDLIIDGGPSRIHDSNTIIDFTFPNPFLVRTGAFPVGKIIPVIPNLDLDSYTYQTHLKKRRQVQTEDLTHLNPLKIRPFCILI